jgi:hypothetical protein
MVPSTREQAPKIQPARFFTNAMNRCRNIKVMVPRARQGPTMVEPLDDNKLGVVIVAHLASVVLLVFGAGAAVRNRFWLAAGLFALAFLAFGIAIWQAKRR